MSVSHSIRRVFTLTPNIYPKYLTNEQIEQRVLAYYQEAQASLDQSTWRSIFGTLDAISVVGVMAMPFIVPVGAVGVADNVTNMVVARSAVSETIFVTPKGVAITSDVLARQGSSRLAGNFRGLEGASVEEIVARVPRDWTMVPQDRGAGIKFLDSQGYERLRIHGPSSTAPVGSNSATGWTLRIMDRAGNYYDNLGNVIPYRANSGHIPIQGNSILGPP